MWSEFAQFAREAGWVLAFLVTIGGLFLGWIVYRLDGKFVSVEDFKGHVKTVEGRLSRHQERLDQGEKRFTELTGQMDNVATKDDMHELHKLLIESQGEAKTLHKALDGINQALSSLNDNYHLLVENELKGGNQ